MDMDRNATISTINNSNLPANPAYITEMIIHTLAAFRVKICRQLYGMKPHSIFSAIFLALAQACVKSLTDAPSIPNDFTTGKPLVYSSAALVNFSFSAFKTFVLSLLCFEIINKNTNETSTPPNAISAHSGTTIPRKIKMHKKFRYPPMKPSNIRIPMFSNVAKPVVIAFRIAPVSLV